MRPNLSPGLFVVGSVLLFVGAFFALYIGILVGHKDDVESDIDAGTEKVLARKVPSGVIDEEAGSYRGVSLGDRAAAVTRQLGEPVRRGPDEVALPGVLTGSVWAGRDYGTCGSRKSLDVLAYREVVFSIANGRVCTFTVAGGGWSTTGGVSAGDSIDDIRDRIPGIACNESTNDDPFYVQWGCETYAESGNRIHFGADPVTTVDVAPPAG